MRHVRDDMTGAWLRETDSCQGNISGQLPCLPAVTALTRAFALVLGAMFLVGCERDSPPPRDPGKTTTVAPVGVAISDEYLRRVKEGTPDFQKLTRIELAEIKKSLRDARNAPPPPCSGKPDQHELFWAFLVGESKGGAWEARLKGLCAKSDPSEIRRAFLSLLPVVDNRAELSWRTIRVVEDHRLLAEFWEYFADAVPGGTNEQPIAVEMGPGSLEHLSPGEAKRWQYLRSKEIWEVATREVDFMGSKWQFACDLSQLNRRAHPRLSATGEKLRTWILSHARERASGCLSKLSRGEMTLASLRKEASWGDAHLECSMLAEYMAESPSQDHAEQVAKWLAAMATGGMPVEPIGPRESSGQAIRRYLPLWKASFPWLDATEKALQPKEGGPGDLRSPPDLRRPGNPWNSRTEQ